MFWRSKKTSQRAPEESKQPQDGQVSSTQFLTGDSSLDQRSVEVLLEAIAGVSQARDLDGLLINIVDRSIEITSAERGLLILAGTDGDLALRVARGQGGVAIEDDIRFSTSIVKKVLEDQSPLRATVQSDSDALELGRSVFDLKLRAVMCVPITSPSTGAGPQAGGGRDREEAPIDAVRGVLYVDSRAATRSFGQRDLSLFAALSQHISIALENARLNLHSLEKAKLEQSLELASAIQSGLMPSLPKDLKGYDLHGWYRAAERTSGDFYDFVRTSSGKLGCVIGDVTGHGIGPALITASAQASLRSYLRVVGDPPQAVTLLNQDLCERMDDGLFVTLLLWILGSDGNCELVNAGHVPPLVWRSRTGEVETVQPHGPALGMMADSTYRVDASLRLEPGDLALLVTDGLVEAHRSGQRENLFGEKRVCDLIAQHGQRATSAEELARLLAESALEFSGGEQEDDITLVVVRRL
jgi:serine phosphatase RsbU (regulator of sigma subunit)